MPVLTSDSCTTYEAHGSRFASYASPAAGTSQQIAAWRCEFSAGSIGVPHRPSRDEVLLVLTGSISVRLDGEGSEVHPGGVVCVPAGAVFQVDAGPEGATAWVTTTPGLEATLPDGTTMSPPWAQ